MSLPRYSATGTLEETEFTGSNPLTGLFLWASKTDRRILRLCARFTQMTHVSRGFFVIETALFAAGAAYYTLITTVSSDATVAFAIAALWGAMILMIDSVFETRTWTQPSDQSMRTPSEESTPVPDSSWTRSRND